MSAADELRSLETTIAALQRSTRRSAPVFALGIAATLIAAAVAVYYIVTLSAGLDRAQAELERTKLALATAQASLAAAQTSLKTAQQSASTTANAARIATALNDVSRSRTEIAAASTTLTQVAARLPSAKPTEPAKAASPQMWFAVAGSFPITPAGLAEAQARVEKLAGALPCTEIWQTEVSRNYAVVIGGPLSQGRAAEQAAIARKMGVVMDAFAQPDRNWRRVEGSPGCDAR